MLIKDIMTQDVITVSKETPLKEAAGLLAKFRVHGLPVVDGNKKVVGIVTESDFFTKDASNIFDKDYPSLSARKILMKLGFKELKERRKGATPMYFDLTNNIKFGP